MKLTTQEIKQKLAEYLEKNGSSIEELEHNLACYRNGITKTAEGKPIKIDLLASFLTGLKSLSYLSMAGGSAAGLAGYGAFKGIQGSEDAVNKKLKQKQMYEDSTKDINTLIQQKQNGGL